MRVYALAPVALLTVAASAPDNVLEVDVSGLRNARGQIHVCITQDPGHFPDCRGDPHALTRTAAASVGSLKFEGLTPGRYAITLFHDENGNQRLDTMLGIPREGFGFSNKVVVRFGAPRFNAVAIQVPAGFSREHIRLQYLL